MPKRIIITGAGGLIGWHAHCRLHAANCAARFNDAPQPYDIVALDHVAFDDDSSLRSALTDADGVLHFAGINRAPDEQLEIGNAAIAHRLVEACSAAAAMPHIVFANSVHAETDTAYGRGKKAAANTLADFADTFTDMVLPHIFGEGARAFYNNVTASLIHELIAGKTPNVNQDGRVNLLHAGGAAQTAIDAVMTGHTGQITPEDLGAHPMSVPDLLAKLTDFHILYQSGIYPDLSDPFDLALFNSYRCASYPIGWPRPLDLKTDERGTLFEAVKGGGGGQTFMSTTQSGVTRGDHFHLSKVERFLVVQGEAIIRIRKLLSNEVWDYPVTGAAPAPVDIPTLHTHSIENVGDIPLLTLFWTHDLFDPQDPDTYADKVLI